ncbi:MAG: ribonuclease J [Desulfosoma sp.]|uniref:ribonuclease J n=1 Tax=Desulfosoma sp. TaxID=2603217 RepID=UPI00404B1EA0
MTMNSSGKTPLRLIPLGGCGEIGLNMLVIEYSETIVVVDAGLMFPEEEMLGIDIVIPDFSYLRENKEKVRALVVTHGHEDHIGAIPFFIREFPVPIYGTPLTLALVEEKLREHKLLERAQLHRMDARDSLPVGPLNIEFIQVCHSIPDGVGLAVESPEGIIVHSGDFKIDHTPLDGKRFDAARFAAYGERGVLALLSDSTNVEKEGYTLSERDIGHTFREIFRECSGRILVAVFASNIHRIQQVLDLAAEFDRKVFFSGKSMVANVRIASQLGYLNFDSDIETNLLELQHLPDHRVLMLTTGSQGEPMSALTRMAFNVHKKLSIKPGDTVVFSSKFIPGNERAIHSIINHLYRRGAQVIHDQVKEIHVSGHAYREELKTMINLVRPAYFIPIHGEYRHLVQHKQLAQRLGLSEERCLVVENGDVISFQDGVASVQKRIETGRVFVDGKGVGDVCDLVLRDRRHLSEDGMVLVSLVVSKETREILSGPEVVSRGFILEETKPDILDSARCLILDALERYQAEGEMMDCGDFQLEIRRELKKFFQKVLERRPFIHPMVVEV